MGPGPLTAGLHLVTLSGFSVAQPLFQLTSRNAEFFVAQTRPLMLGAGILLVLLGIWGFRSTSRTRAGKETKESSGATQRWSFLTGFLLTIANPAALLMLVAALAFLGFVESGIDPRNGVLMVAGIFFLKEKEKSLKNTSSFLA